MPPDPPSCCMFTLFGMALRVVILVAVKLKDSSYERFKILWYYILIA